MKKRFKLAFIVLTVATIVWGIVFYYTLRSEEVLNGNCNS